MSSSFRKEHAIRLICPFTPWMDAHGRSTTCLADRCIQWVWDNKNKDLNKRMGHCCLGSASTGSKDA